jgi:hypothetical protein
VKHLLLLLLLSLTGCELKVAHTVKHSFDRPPIQLPQNVNVYLPSRQPAYRPVYVAPRPVYVRPYCPPGQPCPNVRPYCPPVQPHPHAPPPHVRTCPTADWSFHPLPATPRPEPLHATTPKGIPQCTINPSGPHHQPGGHQIPSSHSFSLPASPQHHSASGWSGHHLSIPTPPKSGNKGMMRVIAGV